MGFRAMGVGAFHAAVEVYGQEWSFGYRPDGGSGIFCSRPRQCDLHIYRESVVMGSTLLSELKVHEIMKRMAKEWPGGNYDVLQRNCCHFSEEFCAKLGVGPLPPWANNFAASVERGVRSAAGAAEAFVGGRSTWTCTSNTAAHSFSFSGDDEDIGNALTRLWRRVQTASRTRSAGVPHVESRCTRD